MTVKTILRLWTVPSPFPATNYQPNHVLKKSKNKVWAIFIAPQHHHFVHRIGSATFRRRRKSRYGAQSVRRVGHTRNSSILILEFICVFFFVSVPVLISCMLCVDSSGWFSGIWCDDNVFTLALESFGGGGGRGNVAVLFWGRSANSGGGSWWWEWWWPRMVAGSPLTPKKCVWVDCFINYYCTYVGGTSNLLFFQRNIVYVIITKLLNAYCGRSWIVQIVT